MKNILPTSPAGEKIPTTTENIFQSPSVQVADILDETFSTCSFVPVQLDPRPNAVNPEVHFGVEITIPGYENITNLDHHRPGDTNETPSSAEQALTCELPKSGINIATVRPDADSMTAMAVLNLRMNNVAFDETLVREIGKFDRLGPSAGEMSIPVSAIWELASDFSKNMEARVLLISRILIGKMSEKEMEEIASKRVQKLEDARKNSTIEVREPQGVKIAIVESSHRFATNLGYELAPVVLAKNPIMPVDFKDPSKGTYVKYTICRYDSNVPCDIESIMKSLQTLESGWGGRGDIIGSPQGVSSVLSTEKVMEIVSFYSMT